MPIYLKMVNIDKERENGVLYGSKPIEINNPHYKSSFKHFTKVVRLWTDGKAGIGIAGFSV